LMPTALDREGTGRRGKKGTRTGEKEKSMRKNVGKISNFQTSHDGGLQTYREPLI